MRSRVRRWIAFALAGIVVVALGLWAAFPPRIEERDGPADPILPVRRAVVGVLEEVNLAPRPSFGLHPWLPSRPAITSWSGADDEETAQDLGTWYAVRWQVEPVYRALFLRVGDRVKVEVELVEDDDADPTVAIRLVASRGASSETIAESTAVERGSCARARRFTVRGFVPSDADGYRYELLAAGGTVSCSSGFSDGSSATSGASEK